ncbi:MAG: protein kinase [Planctomycetota bacterium]
MTLDFDETTWKHGTPLIEYQITEEICSGSAGVLYHALHRQSNKHYTLVMINQLQLNETNRLRFQHLMQTVYAFKHPNIASVHELWRLDELAFLIVELPEGQPLTRAFKPPLSPDSKDGISIGDHVTLAVRLVRDISRALSLAHAQGLTHRDLRQEDIIMQDDGSPVLIGLGWLSWMKRPSSNGNAEAGYTLEVMNGPQESPDGTGNDVRALGLILYSLLTGQSLPMKEGRPVFQKPGRFPDPLWAVLRKAVAEGDYDRSFSYSAAAFSKDLEQYLRPPKIKQPVARKSAPRKPLPEPAAGKPSLTREKWWKRFLPRKFNFLISITLAAITLVCFLALAGLVCFFPDDLQVLSLKSRTSTVLEAVKQARGIQQLDEREQQFNRILEKGSYLSATVPARVELARLYLQRCQWVEALQEFLVVHYQYPSYYLGEDLLELAKQFYNCGNTATSDWLLNKMVDWCQGTESAWNALLLQKHLLLDRNALHRVACSIEAMIEGPMKHKEAFRKQGGVLLQRARSMRIGQYPVPALLWVMGDFLPEEGDEIASLEPEGLVVSGREQRRSFALHNGEVPILLCVVGSRNEKEKKVGLGYESGRLDIFDPAKACLETSFDLKGRLHDQVVYCETGEPSESRLVLAVNNEKGINLAIVDAPNSDQDREMQIFRYKGQELQSLIPVDLFAETPGQELVVIVRHERSRHQLFVLGQEQARGSWKEIFRQQIMGEISCATLVRGAAGSPPELLLGFSSPCTPEEPAPADAAPGSSYSSGIYKLVLLTGNGGPGLANPLPAFSLEPVSLFHAGSSGGSIFVKDACTGDFDHNGRFEAAFLIGYPGHGSIPPETRILVLTDSGDRVWLHCPEATRLDSGSLQGSGEEALIVDKGTSLLQVTW